MRVLVVMMLVVAKRRQTSGKLETEVGSVHDRLKAKRKGVYIKRQIAPALFCVAS